MRKRKAGARQIRPHVGGVPDKCCKGVRNRGKIKSRHLPRKDAVKNYAIKKPRAQSARCGHGENNRGVSIHAPTGGATALIKIKIKIKSFQFTRPRGARRALGFSMRDAYKFQFTRPRGARPILGEPPPENEVSIHAPTGGATEGAVQRDHRGGRFNSRAHGGRDNEGELEL